MSLRLGAGGRSPGGGGETHRDHYTGVHYESAAGHGSSRHQSSVIHFSACFARLPPPQPSLLRASCPFRTELVSSRPVLGLPTTTTTNLLASMGGETMGEGLISSVPSPERDNGWRG